MMTSSINEKLDDTILHIESLQIKVAYQDDTIEQLNEEVLRQQKTLEQLDFMVKQMAEKLKNMQSNDSGINDGDDRPPHY